MAGLVEHFTDDNFTQAVEQAGNLTIVDFWAEWCGPCRMLSPIMEQLAQENKGSVKIGKVDLDKNPKVATKYAVRGAPTLLFFKDGKVMDQIVGARPKNAIQAVIDRNK